MRERQSPQLPGICVSLVPPCRSPQARSCCGGDGQMNDRQYLRGQTVHDAVPFARELIEVAPERVLWGADFPHPNVKWMLNDGDLVDLFAPFGGDVFAPQNPDGQPEPTLLVRREARLIKEINEVGPESLTPTPL